jgi:hypothetical protein
MTQGTPLVRLCPEGFQHWPPLKTNPESWQRARIRASIAHAHDWRPGGWSTAPV